VLSRNDKWRRAVSLPSSNESGWSRGADQLIPRFRPEVDCLCSRMAYAQSFLAMWPDRATPASFPEAVSTKGA